MRRQLSYQPTLFDVLTVAKQEAPVLDIKAARKERDAGIEKAAAHAEEAMEGWNEKAYGVLLMFLQNHTGPFMAEEVRSYAAMMDFPLPPSNRAWGGIIVKARNNGLIKRCGIQPVKNKKANCANAGVWRKAKKHFKN